MLARTHHSRGECSGDRADVTLGFKEFTGLL